MSNNKNMLFLFIILMSMLLLDFHCSSHRYNVRIGETYKTDAGGIQWILNDISCELIEPAIVNSIIKLSKHGFITDYKQPEIIKDSLSTDELKHINSRLAISTSLGTDDFEDRHREFLTWFGFVSNLSAIRQLSLKQQKSFSDIILAVRYSTKDSFGAWYSTYSSVVGVQQGQVWDSDYIHPSIYLSANNNSMICLTFSNQVNGETFVDDPYIKQIIQNIDHSPNF